MELAPSESDQSRMTPGSDPFHMTGNTSWSTMSDAQRRATFEAGVTLRGVQATEHQLSFCLTWIFPKDAAMQLSAIYALDAKHRKRTLGQLVTELRKHATIDGGFDALLDDFVTRRNRFAHHLFTEDEAVLTSDDGAVRATAFMCDLQRTCVQVQDIIFGHFIQWGSTSCNPALRAFTERLLQSHPRLLSVRNRHEEILRVNRPLQ